MSNIFKQYRKRSLAQVHLVEPHGIFVTDNEDVYIDNGYQNRRIDRWTFSATSGAPVMYVEDTCHSVFVDINDTLYCSLIKLHKVMKSSLKDDSNSSTIGAGTGFSGNASNTLSQPYGIFVDINLDLYVADFGNNRIQLFKPGEVNGITIAGSEIACYSATIELIPNHTTFFSPIQIKEHEDIRINSNIKFNCSEVFSTTSQWTIYYCSSYCANPVRLNSSMFSELFIPGNTYPIGFYEIKLRIRMTTASSNLTSSKSVYLKIIRSKPIIVHLDQFGTSEITNGFEQDLLLEPGKYSTDIDGNPIVENVSATTQVSSVKVPAGSLLPSRTYQFMVYVVNLKNRASKYTGSLTVHVQKAIAYKIAIRCIIPTLCNPTRGYQSTNPTTRITLSSTCLDGCPTVKSILWNIYRNPINSFSAMTLSSEANSDHLIITNALFLQPSQNWKFEVLYTFQSGQSSSAISILINQCPSNGTCSISPDKGTTTALFTVSCPNWFDNDGINDYSLYVWITDDSEPIMIAFSIVSNFQVRIPAGDDQNSLVNLVVYIEDRFKCTTKYTIAPMEVFSDRTKIYEFVDNYQQSNNYFTQLIKNGDQNTIGQAIILVSQELNQINRESLENVVSNGIPISSIAVSSLGTHRSPQISIPFNQSILDDYKKQLNSFAIAREFLINHTVNLLIVGINSIILQASSLAELTQTTNELTQFSSFIASRKCQELAKVLQSISTKILYEDIRQAVTLLTQCTSNVLNAINGPLQQRTTILDLDLSRSSDSLVDDFHDPKRIINAIELQIEETRVILSSSLNIHLTLNETFLLNKSSVFMSVQKYTSSEYLRTLIEPLAPHGNSQSNTNLSRSISLSLVNQYGQEISRIDKRIYPMEFLIPRDPNLILPKLILQNVASLNQSFYYQLINLTQIQLNKQLTNSIHFELHPLNRSLAYLIVYYFDEFSRTINGRTLFCPMNLTDREMYTYYIDNQKLINHHSIIFGVRELTKHEVDDFCLTESTRMISIENKNSKFTSSYHLRLYSSGYYYLDENNNWQSDRLLVGPKTNLYQTQCFFN
ncbi:hypothetical protein I4U23_013128 [Adineta vaga]|nr:hypothetical protein I4U23_013128 [Adineta vaga]